MTLHVCCMVSAVHFCLLLSKNTSVKTKTKTTTTNQTKNNASVVTSCFIIKVKLCGNNGLFPYKLENRSTFDYFI